MGKLTVRGIESTKPRDKPYKLIDGDGLQLRIATDGTKTWLVRYVVNGHERQYRLPKNYGNSGPGFCSLQEARDESSTIRAMAREGIDYQLRLVQALEAAQVAAVTEAKRQAEETALQQKDALTIQDMFTAWINDGVRRMDNNAELKRSFGVDVLPKIGNILVKSITEHELRGVLRAMVSRGVNRSAVIARNDLTQMFCWAEKRQPWRKLLADGNPMDLIEIEKIVSRDYDFDNISERKLSADEIRHLQQIFIDLKTQYDKAANKRSAEHPISEVFQCAIWIMLSTLCRVGELSKARWEHVNLETGEWFIPKANVKKNTSDLDVSLSTFSLAQFKKLHVLTGTSEWCFPARNKESHVCVKSMSKQVGDRQSMFKKGKDGKARKPMKNRRHDNTLVLGDGKNGEWTPHDLRRTGATLMQSLGIPLVIIDCCQNHVIPGSKVRRHYLQHEYATEKKDAWQRLGEQLTSILDP
jgi:integrase